VKKKRKKPTSEVEALPKPAAAPAISTSLSGAIANWKQKETADAKQSPKAKKATVVPPVVTMPPPGPSRALPVTVAPASATSRGEIHRALSTEDQNALERAFAGVRPLTERKRGGPSETVLQAKTVARQDDVQARARLNALVGKTAHVVVERQDEFVSGLRDGVTKAILRRLRSETARPEASLDLHGERAVDAANLVTKFVRMQHRKGLRLLLIIHGKGVHSEHGVGILGDLVVGALSSGGAAPLVAAFSTAHASHGGSGALVVELVNG